MENQIIQKSDRFITNVEYQRRYGLSYATVKHMIDSGQLKTIMTESGLKRIDTKTEGINDINKISEELNELKQCVLALMRQFNTPMAKVNA